MYLFIITFSWYLSHFLSSRTSLIPNDSQSWRRLASVYGRLGQHDMAQVANYTAWQLGIGQGGFGGPR